MEHFKNCWADRGVSVCPHETEHGGSYECITGIMYAQTHIHVARNKLIVARFCILINLLFTYLISWNKPAMRAAKAQTSLRIRGKSPAPDIQKSLYLPHVCRCMYPDFVTWEDQPAYRTRSLISTLFLEQNIKHFVGPDLGRNCPLNISLSQPLGGGGGGGWVQHC